MQTPTTISGPHNSPRHGQTISQQGYKNIPLPIHHVSIHPQLWKPVDGINGRPSHVTIGTKHSSSQHDLPVHTDAARTSTSSPTSPTSSSTRVPTTAPQLRGTLDAVRTRTHPVHPEPATRAQHPQHPHAVLPTQRRRTATTKLQHTRGSVLQSKLSRRGTRRGLRRSR